MKKLIDGIDTLVADMLEGIVRGNPELALLQGQLVVVRSDIDALKARGEVTLISGGGSGHEPAHAGYIGPGMLSAAVCGDVFTSPSTDAVLAAIRAVAGAGGVLVIVKNYTGDRLNFGLAVELARAAGIAAEMVVVADDAALAAHGDHAGRRGIAGTVLVHKIAGAVASAGGTLAQVKAAALRAIANVASMGVALSACTVPAAGRAGFELPEGEVELGLGIHGEAGVRRVPMAPARELVGRLVDTLVGDRQLVPGDRIALLVNNLGSTPAQEMAIVTRDALARLSELGISVERVWSGTFLTALEMAGVSLSVLRLDAESLNLLDAPSRTMAWPAFISGRTAEPRYIAIAPAFATGADAVDLLPAPTPGVDSTSPVVRAIEAVCASLIAEEDRLTRLDQIVGDGDLGISLARGSRALQAELGSYPLYDVPATLRAMSATLRRSLGGTSGPLYAIGLLRAAAALEQASASSHDLADSCASMLENASAGISELGGAVQGDRTMLDALIPAAAALRAQVASGASMVDAWPLAIDAAATGCAGTAERVARRGRASYLGGRALGHVDPGAEAVVVWLRALTPFLSDSAGSASGGAMSSKVSR